MAAYVFVEHCVMVTPMYAVMRLPLFKRYSRKQSGVKIKAKADNLHRGMV